MPNIFKFLAKWRTQGQYISYQELCELLEIVKDDTKIDDYLTERGFEYDTSLSDKVKKNYSYQKLIGNDLYIVGVQIDLNKGLIRVSESSRNYARRKYYERIVNGNGYIMKNFDNTDGVLWVTHESAEYDLTIAQSPEDTFGTLYSIFLKKRTDSYFAEQYIEIRRNSIL